MRLLFASLIEGYWGGSEILWSRTAIHAADNGHSVAAFFPYYKNIPQTRGLDQHRIELHYGSASPARWWRRLVSPSQTRDERFRRTLIGHKPDLVIINQGGVRDGLTEMKTCREHNVPYVIVN
jgi:hypothetical protein